VNSRGEPGRPARKMTTYTECYTNGDAPEEASPRITISLEQPSTDGLGQAAARWRISFVWLARLLLHICFAAYVVAFPFCTGHNLRAPCCMKNK